jgi:hypothetical protein
LVSRLSLVGVLLAAAVGTLGCGQNDEGGEVNGSGVEGGGQGTSVGLRKAGLVRCAGPVRANNGASVSLYADKGFAAVLASGHAATSDAIDLVEIRTGNDASSKPEVRSRERSWYRTAIRALPHADTPKHPCRTGLDRLPVLADTEVLCFDEVLIPLGERTAKNRFIDVLRTLYQVKVKLVLKGRRYGRYTYDPGHYERQVEENRPYCREP